MFVESIKLMVVGMGMTFCFLILLVFAMKALSLLVEILNKISPEIAPTQKVPSLGKELKIAIALAAIKSVK